MAWFWIVTARSLPERIAEARSAILIERKKYSPVRQIDEHRTA